jgi:hypothetical protein
VVVGYPQAIIIIKGGVSLALKEGSSTGVDAVDVLHVLAAFQTINKCHLYGMFEVTGTDARPTLVLTISAWDGPMDLPEARPLASQKSPIGSSGPRTMEAAILQALYAIDGQLAEEEFARVNKK